MEEKVLVRRFRMFAYSVYHLVKKIKFNPDDRILISQLVDAAFSSAANYRASQRAKSTRDFVNKIKIVLEEIDEANFWLTCMDDLKISQDIALAKTIKESDDLTAITVSILKKIND
ncbi:MAG: four helix bundle protein [Chitinophagales bacterium]